MAVVRWSPTWDTEFAVCGQDLRIYQYLEKDSDYVRDVNDVTLSHEAYGRMVCLGKGYDCSKHRLAWAAIQDRPRTFAVSHTHGTIELASFGGEKEVKNTVFNPRIKRNCTALAWNQTQSNYLAIGYKVDKSTRSDGSLFVINVGEASGGATMLPSGASGGGMGPSLETTPTKVVLEQSGESVSSVSWLPWEPNLVAAAMGKNIRIYDIRDEIKNQRPAAATAALKASEIELCADPFSTYRLSTFVRDHAGVGVTVWDTRQLSRPIFTIFRVGSGGSVVPGTAVLKAQWSPTQSGRLAVLTSTSPSLHIGSVPTGLDESHESDANEFNVRWRTSSQSTGQLVDMDWHWRWSNSLLTVNSVGDVRAVSVSNPTPLCWDAHSTLCHMEGGEYLQQTSTEKCSSSEVDVSVVMRDRANQGYAFDPLKNASIVEDNPSLSNLWSWLAKQQRMMQSEKLPSECLNPLPGNASRKTIPGVLPVLTGDFSPKGMCSKPRVITLRHLVKATTTGAPNFEVYESVERHQCLLMCGWDMREEGLESFFKREEMNDRHERAAALSVFNGYIEPSIRTLKYSANITAQQGQPERSAMLTMAALALAGYRPREQGANLWQKTCKELKDTLKEPYLRAMFSYLSSNDARDFLAILEDDRITYEDKVAFAVMYLDRSKLVPYVEGLKNKLIREGNLQGLFLTGINEDGLKLLSKYVDETSDVQTACMVTGQVAGFLRKDQLVTGWFKCYRELLNMWRLWHHRVSLDIAQKERDVSKSVVTQVFLCCNFCGKAINSSGAISSMNSGQRKKVTSCPQCHKPLPRCAICLMYMGMGGSSSYNFSISTGTSPSTSFDHWFTWCQTCRHGGHAAHILEWFESHTECPIPRCQCKCMSIDGSGEVDANLHTGQAT